MSVTCLLPQLCRLDMLGPVNTCPHVSHHVLPVLVIVIIMLPPHSHAVLNTGNPDAKRLYDDLLSNYNKLVRPVQNTTDPLTVRIKLKLSQLIDVVRFTLFIVFVKAETEKYCLVKMMI